MFNGYGCGKWRMVNNVNDGETIINDLGMVNIPSIKMVKLEMVDFCFTNIRPF
jgi:hypothetical protein